MRKMFTLLALAPLASCASDHHGTLDGTWSLTHINHQPVNLLHTQPAPTITFAEGSISDNAAHPAHATYVRDDDGRAYSIEMPGLANTDIHAGYVEASYRSALQRADSARVIDGRLYLWDGAQEVLRFGHTRSAQH